MAPFNCVYDYKFTNEASTEPVILADAKLWLRVDVSDDDTLITALIKAARITLEHYLNQSIIARTVTAVLNNSNGNVYLPFQPFNEIVSIKDVEGNDITIGNYKLIGERFKRLSEPCSNNITIVYTAGEATITEQLKTAIKFQLSFMYENRGDETKDIYNAVSPMAKSLLKSLRR